MKTKNSSYRFMILAATAIYCILLFGLVQEYTAKLWILFGFTVAAPILALLKSFQRASFLHRRVLTSAFTWLLCVYTVCQLLGHLLLLIPSLSTKLVLIAETVFALIMLILACCLKRSNKEIKQRLAAQEKKLRYLASLQIALQESYESGRDDAVKNALNQLIEAVQYSPFASIPEVEHLEKDMLKLANQLAAQPPEEQMKTVLRIESILNKRNRMISMF